MATPRWQLLMPVFGAALIVGGASQGAGQLEGVQSRFVDEVRAANYEQLAPPAEPVLLRWNFAEGKNYTYDLTETSENTSHFSAVPEKEAEQPRRSTSAGKFEIKAEGDHTAKIVLSDVEMVIDTKEDEQENSLSTMKMPPVVVPGLHEDGTVPVGASQQNAMFRLLFPLPDLPLAAGEKSTVPYRLPVNMFGSPLVAEGEIEVTFVGLVYVRGKVCAQVDFTVGIEQPEIPEEVETKFEISLSGVGRYFFDVEAGRLVESTVAVIMSMEAEFPSELMSPAIEDGEGPDVSTMSMSSDALVRLTSD